MPQEASHSLVHQGNIPERGEVSTMGCRQVWLCPSDIVKARPVWILGWGVQTVLAQLLRGCWGSKAQDPLPTASLLASSSNTMHSSPAYKKSKLLVPSENQQFLFLCHQTQQLYDEFVEEKPKELLKNSEQVAAKKYHE